jgi:uncharacterized membrane protein
MPPQTRISAVDVLRGLVMIIMALDHTRDFFHAEAITDDPLNLATTTPFLFFTRWITHFCAPVFVFLSGTSVYFQSLLKSKKALAGFLVSRGLWLILLELVVITFAVSFDTSYSVFVLQVIWAIGISMVFLGLLIRLPFAAILTIGIVIVAGHNLLDAYESTQKDFPVWYSLLHKQSIAPLPTGRSLLIFYPFLPWTGVMILGYCFGKFYMSHLASKNRRSIYLGVTLIILFILLRWIDVYGDPKPWSQQKNFLYTLFSFIDTQKYPPSLLYLFMTIGPSLMLLGLFGEVRNKFTAVVSVYGRVPLFYYILHFFLIHIICVILFLARGHSLSEGLAGAPNSPFKFVVPGEGYGLGIVYLIWMGVVIFLYPVCKWYSVYKFADRRRWWLSYL